MDTDTDPTLPHLRRFPTPTSSRIVEQKTLAYRNNFHLESEEKGQTENLKREGWLENDVLRFKIDVDAMNHETEKRKIINEKEKIIEALENENETLKIKVGDQADKIRQLDSANDKKDKEIIIMKKREKELLEKKLQLENEIEEIIEMQKQSKKAYKQQNDEIKRLKNELAEVKDELKLMKVAKEEQEKIFKKTVSRDATRSEDSRQRDARLHTENY